MGHQVKLSICIPTYNQVQFVKQALESALQQEFDSFEIVVSDNHCTDGTGEYLASVSDPRLRVVRPPTHLPVTPHFDFCAAQATGEYQTFLSSDNILYPQYAAQMSAALDRVPSAAFGYCAADLINGDGNKIGLERHVGGNCHRSREEALARFMRGARCVFDAMMIRRDLYQRCGGLGVPRNGVYMLEVPDWDLDLRLAALGDVYYLDETLVGFRFWEAQNRTTSVRRLPGYIADIALMFETTVEEIIAAFPDLKPAAARARRRVGTNCAVGVGQLVRLDTYDRAVRDVKRIYDSPLVRLILLSQRFGMAPLMGAYQDAKVLLRRHVKELLYQN